ERVEAPSAGSLEEVPVIHVVERDLQEIVRDSYGPKIRGQWEEAATIILQLSLPVETHELEIVEKAVRANADRLRAEGLRRTHHVSIDVLVASIRRRLGAAPPAQGIAVSAEVRVQGALVSAHLDAWMRAKERGAHTSLVEQPQRVGKHFLARPLDIDGEIDLG